MTAAGLDDVALRNMSQVSGSGLGSSVGTSHYSIPRRPVGSNGVRETSPLVQPDGACTNARTSILNPAHGDERQSHYSDTSGMSRSI
jgi:hypothetical protein